MSDFQPEFFGGNTDAARLVEHLSVIAHVWDDLVDRDRPVSADVINRCFELALVHVPANPFYRAYTSALQPLIYTGVLGYVTANIMEQSGDPHSIEIAHGLRYAVANVAAFAVAVTNPPDQVPVILADAWKQWMPERFENYRKEHCHVD